MIRFFTPGFFLFFFACAARADESRILFDAMEPEMRRIMDASYQDCPKPYFVSLRLTQDSSRQVDYREGAVVSESVDENVYFVPELRVGNYAFDQSPDDWAAYAQNQPLPIKVDPKIVRHYIWAGLDDAYKDACSFYFTKKAKRSAEGVPDYVTDDFSQVPAGRSEEAEPKIEDGFYRNTAAAASVLLGGNPEIMRSLAAFQEFRRRTHFINSEGTRRVGWEGRSKLYLSLYGRSLKGLPVHVTRIYYGTGIASLPTEAQLKLEIARMKELYFELYRSSEAQSALAPCILDSQAASQLFTAFAQRLEGERQRDPGEPQTFRSKIGERILPAFLTLIDDPTRREWNQTVLLGSYRFDEEGVAAQPVTLVEKGRLANFLLSRRPVKGMPLRSNGHGRANAGYPSHARPASLFVESPRALSAKELREKLLQEVRRRKLPFGIVAEGLDLSGQDAGTGAHQTFRGAVQRMTLVYEDGTESVVHHGEIVGTPLNLMQSILATGNEREAHNFLVPGPSGSVPSSAVSPPILIGEIEVQKGGARPQQPPVIPSPLNLSTP